MWTVLSFQVFALCASELAYAQQVDKLEKARKDAQSIIQQNTSNSNKLRAKVLHAGSVDGSCSGKRAYTRAAVETFSKDVVDAVNSALNEDFETGLKAYAMKRLAPFPQPTASPCFGDQRVIPAEQVEETLTANLRVINSIVKIPSITLDITIVSSPSEADYELTPDAAKISRRNRTDGAEKNIYRGIYRLHISKSGYKAVDQPDIDLVDGSPQRISCHLRRIGEEGSDGCKME